MYEQVMEAITREQNSKIVQFEMSENIGCLVQGGSMFGDEWIRTEFSSLKSLIIALLSLEYKEVL